MDLVNSKHRGPLALVEVDHPPMNALSHGVRLGLAAALERAQTDTAIRVVVIHGKGRNFCAGAEVTEFDVGPPDPQLNDVLSTLEASNKPVIAVLHGWVLGGGLELALASHFRIAHKDARLGFPEIKLGLMPGSGGTQRLPRLIGCERALAMMLSGEPISAPEAHAQRIVDEVIDADDVLAAAIGIINERLDTLTPRRLSEQPAPAAPDRQVCARLIGDSAKQNRGLVAPVCIMEAVEAASSMPFAPALAHSRTLFHRCRVDDGSRALRRLFLAERNAAALDTTVAVTPVAAVGVIGAGTMGAGIAYSMAAAGYRVTLLDTTETGLARGLGHVRALAEAARTKGRLSDSETAALVAAVSGTKQLEALRGADLVVEAVFENLGVKQEVFAKLGDICRPDAVLATNTSTLDVDQIAGSARHPERVVGMHFFSPAHVMKLVEIVRGKNSAPSAIHTALALTRKIGKLGVVVGNGFGFVGNRMLYAYGRENQMMMLQGAAPQQIDRALKDFGMAMGPNAVGDLAGLDVGYRVRREHRHLSVDPCYYRVADLMVEAGRLGQKSGRGIYAYVAGSREPQVDPEVEPMIVAEAQRLGVTRRTFNDAEIVERCMLALVNEGMRILQEGIARSAEDIDVIWCNGYGYPRFRGGPLFYAQAIGLDKVVTALRALARDTGAAYWQPARSLEQWAAALPPENLRLSSI
jgi:3-hydroxyacyl-CoA dehydrogenase